MLTIPIAGPLNRRTLDRPLSKLWAQHHTRDGAWTALHIDLSDCTFVEVSGALVLCALAHLLATGGRQTLTTPPRDAEVAHYSRVCGLEAALGLGGIAPRAGEAAHTGAFLLPLCRVATESDVLAVGDFAFRSASRCLSHVPTSATRVRSVLDALCENIVVHAHAGEGGWAAAQAHRTTDGTPFVRIAIADVGLGIPTTIGRRYPHLAGDTTGIHCRAIEYAVEPRVTGLDGGGGIGLTQVRDLVDDCAGTLDIRSLCGRVQFGIHDITRHGVPLFPGTQLNVLLRPQ